MSTSKKTSEPRAPKKKPAPTYTPQEIHALRMGRGHSFATAAAVAEVDISTWKKWESGKRRPTAQIVELYLIRSEPVTA